MTQKIHTGFDSTDTIQSDMGKALSKYAILWRSLSGQNGGSAPKDCEVLKERKEAKDD